MSSFHPAHHGLKSLVVRDFRNIAFAQIEFSPHHNLLVGPNGHGKTNYLEAISVACSLRPMQGLNNCDLVRFQTSQAKILAEFSGHQRLEIEILPLGKKARLNERPLKATQELARAISLVSFIPAELSMVSGTNALRRRALDQASASLFFEYANGLKSYEKLLSHRNRLLKDWPIDKTLLKTFTDLLIKEAAQIIFFRLQTLDKMESIFAQLIKDILGQNHTGTLGYVRKDQVESKLSLHDILAKLSDEHTQVFSHELKRRMTLFGPHLDDLAFNLDGINAKRTASRGQSRAIVLAWKLAQMLAIQQIRGQAPIIILDDIVSELDSHVRRNLLKTIDSLKPQTFFSSTDIEAFGQDVKNVYHIKDGSVVKRE